MFSSTTLNVNITKLFCGLHRPQYAFIVANGGHIGVTNGGHIGDFSGVTEKGKLCQLMSFLTPPLDLDVMALCDWFNHLGGQNKTSPDAVFTYMLDYNFNIYKFILFYVLNYMNRSGQ